MKKQAKQRTIPDALVCDVLPDLHMQAPPNAVLFSVKTVRTAINKNPYIRIAKSFNH